MHCCAFAAKLLSPHRLGLSQEKQKAGTNVPAFSIISSQDLGCRQPSSSAEISITCNQDQHCAKVAITAVYFVQTELKPFVTSAVIGNRRDYDVTTSYAETDSQTKPQSGPRAEDHGILRSAGLWTKSRRGSNSKPIQPASRLC